MSAREQALRYGFFGDRRYLSNFDETSFVFNKQTYKSVEHAYQSLKSKDHDEQKKVRDADTPGKTKRLGRDITLRADWETIKFKLMEKLVFEKFSQNDDLKDKLIETGDDFLVEYNWWNDRIWGVCDGKGRNRLGHILMKVRDILKDSDK